MCSVEGARGCVCVGGGVLRSGGKDFARSLNKHIVILQKI